MLDWQVAMAQAGLEDQGSRIQESPVDHSPSLDTGAFILIAKRNMIIPTKEFKRPPHDD
jgi:hypothetical protein